MKAMAIEAYGGPGELKRRDMPLPMPADDEVQIALAYTSVNPVDWKIREGYLRDAFPYEFPIIPGWDAAGTVSVVGKNATTSYRGGERVYAYTRKPVIHWGTYAEYVTVRADAVAPMPKNLNFAQAASIPLTGLTAWQALIDFGGLHADQTVLIHAGAGGVGGMALQLARYARAKAVYTTARRANHDYVRRLGAHQAIDYAAENFVAAVQRVEPEGVDLLFDTMGGTVLRESYKLVKRGGTLVSIVDRPDERAGQARGIRAGYVFVEPNGEQLRTLTGLIEQGAVKAPRLQEMRLEEAAAAQEQSRGRHVCGKIVLRIK